MNYCIVMKKSWFIFSRFMSFPSKLLKNIIIFSVHRRPFRLTRKQAKKLITLFNVHTPLNVPQYQIAFYFRSKNSLITDQVQKLFLESSAASLCCHLQSAFTLVF